MYGGCAPGHGIVSGTRVNVPTGRLGLEKTGGMALLQNEVRTTCTPSPGHAHSLSICVKRLHVLRATHGWQ